MCMCHIKFKRIWIHFRQPINPTTMLWKFTVRLGRFTKSALRCHIGVDYSLYSANYTVLSSWRSVGCSRTSVRAIRNVHTPEPFTTPANATTTTQQTPQTESHPRFSNKVYNNVTPGIESKLNRKLYKQQNHPLQILKREIEDYFNLNYRQKLQNTRPPLCASSTATNGNKTVPLFKVFDDLDPRVSVQANFDDLLVPAGHVSREVTDTFYYDEQTCLRTHTSAHQLDFLRAGHNTFLVCGDCYRRDEIDASHYPVFHQMEGVRVWSLDDTPDITEEYVLEDLKKTLEGLSQYLFGKAKQRWIDAYFPFTHPSLELEVFFNEKWLEILGCGLIQQPILTNAGRHNSIGWAFGMGLERLAMVLFDIPDIRLFWSTDSRFLDQFSSGKVVKFASFSKYPPCYKDVSFWLPKYEDGESWHENNFAALVREAAGDLVESVRCVDDFTNKKTGRQSKCYRIEYRGLDRNLLNSEIDVLQMKVREAITQALGVELR